MSTPEISRGEDATFKVKLRLKNGDPYDLTGITLASLKFRKQNGGYHTIDSSQTPAKAATGSYGSVTYTAVTAGENGNTITLVFDGVKTIAQVVSDWNTAHGSNTVGHNSSTPTTVPAAGTLVLSGGRDPFYKVEAISPLVLGQLQVKMVEEDTNLLALGKRLTLFVTVDKGIHPQGERRKSKIVDAYDVIDAP